MPWYCPICRGQHEVAAAVTCPNEIAKLRTQVESLRADKTSEYLQERLDAALLQNRERLDLLDYAWSIICNAGGGDWTRESKDWQEAAARLREQYHAILRTVEKPKPDVEPYNLPCGCYLKSHPDDIGGGVEEARCEAHAEIEIRAIAELRKTEKRNCDGCSGDGHFIDEVENIQVLCGKCNGTGKV